MEYVDQYLRTMTASCTSSVSESTIEEARQYASSSAEVAALLQKFSKLSFVDKQHLCSIFDNDHEVDTLPQSKRLQALHDLRSRAAILAGGSNVKQAFLIACIDSEIELAKKPECMETIMYHRARSFAFTMLYIVKEHFLPLFLLGNLGLEYTCDFALAAVIHDDAEDAEEDAAAESPTIFTANQFAPAYAMSILARLEAKSYASLLNGVLSSLGVIDLKPLVLLGIAKTREHQGLCARTPCVDIVKALQQIE
jgi:hypothetical protein